MTGVVVDIGSDYDALSRAVDGADVVVHLVQGVKRLFGPSLRRRG